MDKVRINIEIGGHKHPLDVTIDEEPVYREAGRLVNEKLQVYATKYRGSNLPGDFMLAFTALDIATHYIRLRNGKNLDDEENALLELADDLKNFLKKE